MSQTQNYRNHARFNPLFHFVVMLSLLANLIWSGSRLYQHGMSGEALMGLLVAIALILMALSLRIQVLTVQDRVIRLEMRLRLARVLPADLQPRIETLSPKQLVALRFASDGELPALVREVLGGTLTDQKSIKLKVQSWQGDFLRA